MRDAGFDQDATGLMQAIRHTRASGRSTKRLLWGIIVGAILIALAGTTYFLAASRERISLNGEWIARMQRPGQRPYNVRLRLETSGRTLTGQVNYPTGSATIEGGTYERRRLTFYTRHVPQFGTEAVTIKFAGEQRGREVELMATTPDGTVTKGIARKVE
jgi:hypothetical protein